ncbi:MAG: sulfite exporter TauE/SafE family protein [Actinomycetia bacterium]|nr:sulfite exporter TauE/SafE family protein [Actinomycetes bacterium]MCP4224391.1 sulfite exporter TauE/SafE family protein [Actinomycetes bacterium]MCP5030721.1 sulfite exporter TauE/SafE family protein [Actinomycetes bacterium]
MTGLEALLILVGGFLAGMINAMAGGGSLLTVPLLSLAGLGGTVANGTNRVAVLVQNASSAWGYARKGVGDRDRTLAVLAPTAAGALIGSVVASQINDRLFERIFGLLMIPLLVLSLWPSRSKEAQTDGTGEPAQTWAPWLTYTAFFGLGIYGGAVQAGIGIILLLVLSRTGFDLVTANGVKTLVILVITIVAVPVFVANGQVRWLHALVLSVGAGVGGFVGANAAIKGGERLIKPVLVAVVLVLASRMIGLWELFD